MKKTKTLTLAMAGLLFFLAAGGVAQINTNLGFKKVVKLRPTEWGRKLDAGGILKLRQEPNGGEYFAVRMFANVRDGAVFTVLVRRSSSTANTGLYEVGSINMVLRSGILELKKPGDDTSKAFPVRGINGVIVKYRGKILARAGFALTP